MLKEKERVGEKRRKAGKRAGVGEFNIWVWGLKFNPLSHNKSPFLF